MMLQRLREACWRGSWKASGGLRRPLAGDQVRSPATIVILKNLEGSFLLKRIFQCRKTPRIFFSVGFGIWLWLPEFQEQSNAAGNPNVDSVILLSQNLWWKAYGYLYFFSKFWPLGGLLGASWEPLGSLLGALGGLLGASWELLGVSWVVLGVLWDAGKAPRESFWWSWGALGDSWSALGALLVPLGALLGSPGGILGSSWEHSGVILR